MILREGVETVLFLAATSFTSSGLARFVGAGLGLCLAALFAVFLIRGSLKVDIGKFFRVTTLVLYVLAFQLIVGGLHELAESGIVPSTKAIWRSSGRSCVTTRTSSSRARARDRLVAVARTSRAPQRRKWALPTPPRSAVLSKPRRAASAARRSVRSSQARRHGDPRPGVVLEPARRHKRSPASSRDSSGHDRSRAASVKGRPHPLLRDHGTLSHGHAAPVLHDRKSDANCRRAWTRARSAAISGTTRGRRRQVPQLLVGPSIWPRSRGTGGCNPIPVASRVEGDRASRRRFVRLRQAHPRPGQSVVARCSCAR